MTGQLFESVILKRTFVAFTLGNRRIRLYPIVVAFATSFQFPSTRASMVKAFTRCPRRIYSCTRKRLNKVGLPKYIVNDAFVTLSSVAQYVSCLPSITLSAPNFFELPRTFEASAFVFTARLT